MNKYIKGIALIFKSPSKGYSLVKSISKGLLYIILYRIFRRNIKIKFPFFVKCKLRFKGPGSVYIGKNCTVCANTLDDVNIITFTPEAKVEIGENCTLGGITIRCLNSVKIGNYALTAANLIQDFMMIPEMDKINDTFSKPIIIGNNVWLGGQSCVLYGSVIGDTSVLGVHSLCFDTTINDGCLANGSPITKPLPISNILKLSSKRFDQSGN